MPKKRSLSLRRQRKTSLRKTGKKVINKTKTKNKKKLNVIQRTLLGVGIFCALITLFDFAIMYNVGLRSISRQIVDLYQSSIDLMAFPDGYFVDINSPTCEDIPEAGTPGNPWCTIQYAVSVGSPVEPGDTIYIRKGVYKESINFGKDGTALEKITLTNFKKEEVIIDGSITLNNWELYQDKIYQTDFSSNPYAVFVNDNLIEKVWPLPDEAIVGDLNDYLLYDQWTYDDVNDQILIKLKKPPQKYKIEVPAKQYGITTNGKKFWEIKGLIIIRFKTTAIRSTGSGSCEQDYLTIKSNIIARNEYTAISIGWCPGAIIENNLIAKNGLIWEKSHLRHQGVKAGEEWELYPGSSTIYQTVKGSECHNNRCNAGPEFMYYDGMELTYNYEAREADDPTLLSENEWTTLGPDGEEYNELYFYPPGGADPTGHRVKRVVYVTMMAGSDIGGHGILLNTPAGQEGRFVIKNNQIRNNNSKGISVCYSPGYCLDSVEGSVIYGNYILNSGESGVDGAGSRGVTFAYNKLWQNGIRDIENNGLNGHGDKGLLGTNSWRVHHNTIHSSGNVEHGFGHYNTHFFHNTLVKDMHPVDQTIGCGNYGGQNSYLRPESYDDLKMKNNIFAIYEEGNHIEECGGLASVIGLDVQSGSITNNVDFNGNNYYTVEPIKTHTIGSKCLTPDQGPECINNNFMEAFPNEHRTDGIFDSFAIDPQFINRTDNNLQLQSNSPLVDQGVPLTFTTQNGNSNIVFLDDALYFHDVDNYQNLPRNEKTRINNQVCIILGVDYNTNTITCNEIINYNIGDKVYWNYSGAKPDLGAFEIGLSNALQSIDVTSNYAL